MTEMTVTVKGREERSKGANRRLRKAGQIPAIVYGAGLDALPIGVDSRVVENLVKSSGENAVFQLQLEGTEQSRHAMIRDLQIDPRNGALIHVDFIRLVMDQEVTVSVPISIEGVPEGVKTEGGMLDFVTREVELSCLPSNIPQSLELDVSELHLGQHVEAGELSLPEGVVLASEPERVIVSVSIAMMQEEEEEVSEEEELLETETEEPDVIGEQEDD